jgi:hypothetical protein
VVEIRGGEGRDGAVGGKVIGYGRLNIVLIDFGRPIRAVFGGR